MSDRMNRNCNRLIAKLAMVPISQVEVLSGDGMAPTDFMKAIQEKLKKRKTYVQLDSLIS